MGATTIIIEHRLEDVLYRPVDRFYWSMMAPSSLTVAQMSFIKCSLTGKWDSRTSICNGFYVSWDLTRGDVQNLSQLDALDLSDLVLPDRVLKDKRDSSSDSILKVEGLSVSYGDNPAIIEDMSFSLKR